jgi:transposase
LKQLIELEETGYIDLFFTDESSFRLTPCIPYGWQPIGVQYGIRSSRDRATILFGLMSRLGKLKAYATPNHPNSDFIIACIDEVALSIEKPTVLVMDNAPWHKSEKMLRRRKAWEEKELFIFYLPTYSPHLNLIETLWRKMKYEWLKPKDYLSKETLKNAVFDIIRNYDKLFCINFSKN